MDFGGFEGSWGWVHVLVFRKLSGGIERSRGPLLRCLGRSRDQKEAAMGSYIRCLGCVMGPTFVV